MLAKGMGMRIIRVAVAMAAAGFATWLGCSVTRAADAPSGAPAPVVLELFTSQGCSSCPPADQLLGRLAEEPNLLALSRPVTYWDDLGWKDTLAREENTRKQRAYQAGLQGRPGVYTPQIVVNGRWGGVGSDERAIRQAIAAAKPGPGRIELASVAGSRAAFTVRGAAGSEITVVGFTPAVSVPIGRGENTGRRITYANVVRSELRLGKATGDAARFEVDLTPLQEAGASGFAVLAQQGRAGPILGAALLP